MDSWRLKGLLDVRVRYLWKVDARCIYQVKGILEISVNVSSTISTISSISSIFSFSFSFPFLFPYPYPFHFYFIFTSTSKNILINEKRYCYYKV